MALPDDIKINGRTASYTYRTSGKYRLIIAPGLEARVVGQGAQGGGGGAGYSRGDDEGEAGGRIVPGQPGKMGEYFESEWMKIADVLESSVGGGGKGGRGVKGLHGGKGADGWVRVEIRAIGLRARLLSVSSRFWSKASPWFTWRNFMKAGAVASIIGAIFGVTAVTCG